ncbi:hypothetical protein ACROYT_G036013 [Oculina patagonica]
MKRFIIAIVLLSTVCTLLSDEVMGSSLRNKRAGPILDQPKCPKLKPGTVGFCVEACSGDNDCPAGYLCCSNGCGHTCQPAIRTLYFTDSALKSYTIMNGKLLMILLVCFMLSNVPECSARPEEKPCRDPLPDIHCGRGPNRQDCPAGYACVIHPTDRYAVCCPDVSNGRYIQGK